MAKKDNEFSETVEATLETIKKRGAEIGGKLRETFEHASEDARETWKEKVKPRLSQAEKVVSETAEQVGSQLNEATEDALGKVKKRFGELRNEVKDEIEKRRGAKST